MKKIVLAFDSFKGCLTAREACDAARQAVLQRWPGVNVVSLPLSDGGEGLVENMWQTAEPGIWQERTVQVHGPMGTMVTAHYLEHVDGKTACLEMAQAAGLTLVPVGQRNPELASTYGVGSGYSKIG